MLPRRAVIALSATAVAVALLLNFRTPPANLQALGAAGGTVAIGQQSVAGGAGASSGPAGSGPAGGTVSGAGGTAASQAPASSSDPSAASGQSGSSSGAGAGATGGSGGSSGATASLRNGSYTGSSVDTPFGPVQVQVTIQGGRIADVQALQTPSSHGRSIMINAYAAPLLRQEVLAAQSAQIDVVSGATYTSMAYAQSLQSALGQARA